MHFNAMCIVDDPVQDGIGNGLFSDHLLPHSNRHLGGEHGGGLSVPVLDNVHHDVDTGSIRWLQTEVINMRLIVFGAWPIK